MIIADKVGGDSAVVEITLKDGTNLTIDASRIRMKGLKIQDSSSSSGSFDIGYTTMKVCTLIIKNTDEKYSLYDFSGAVVKPYVINNGTNYPKGVYRVNKPLANKGNITLTCYDDMYLTEKEYKGTITTPCTRLYAIQKIGFECGISISTSTFTDSDKIIESIPDSVKTYRQLAGYIAQVTGSVLSQTDSGIFTFKDYDRNVFNETVLSGGDFINYGTGDNADGGTLADYTTGDNYDGGSLAEMSKFHSFYRMSNLTVSTDETVITGIAAKVGETTYTVGTDDYMLSIENNPLITESNVQSVLSTLSDKYVGMRFRALSANIASDFRIDAMDPAKVTDSKGNSYNCYITNTTYVAGGRTEISCDAKGKDDAKFTSPVTKLLSKASEEADKKISSYNMQVQSLANLMSMSVGMHETYEEEPDGSFVYYQHDKPTLAESSVIWKKTIDGFAVSTDGGETWNAGMDANGNAAINLLSAVGIRFDWAQGGTLTLGGLTNGNGRLKVLDANGNGIGYLDNSGLHLGTAYMNTNVLGNSDGLNGYIMEKDVLTYMKDGKTLAEIGTFLDGKSGYIGLSNTGDSGSMKCIFCTDTVYGYALSANCIFMAYMLDATCDVYVGRDLYLSHGLTATYDVGDGPQNIFISGEKLLKLAQFADTL